jgi:organic radical activating enzyme
MVDLIYGRGLTDIIHEMPFYMQIFKKIISIKLFHSKPAMYGSVDVNNVCNLHCSHCYWWLNRKEEDDLTIEEWRNIINNKFKKQNIFVVTLVGGEPLLRPDLIKLFCDEMPKRVCVVTNGTIPLKRFENLYFYWISLDGTEKVHDSIRGKGSYAMTRKNIFEYIEKQPKRTGKPAWKDIWISMTINSVNYSSVIYLANEWKDKVNKIGFQFHTPFVKDDPLWLTFGDTRNKVVDDIISMKRAYPDYIVNTEKQISLMKGNWGGIDTTPVQCPSWAILSLDHMGRVKQPCCIGSANNKGLKPICEKYGLGCYSIPVSQGIKGN